MLLDNIVNKRGETLLEQQWQKKKVRKNASPHFYINQDKLEIIRQFKCYDFLASNCWWLRRRTPAPQNCTINYKGEKQKKQGLIRNQNLEYLDLYIDFNSLHIKFKWAELYSKGNLAECSVYSTMAEGARRPLQIWWTVAKRGNNSNHPRWLRTS